MCICIGQTSSLQSSTGGAESDFFRLLSVVHNNNNCSAFIPLWDSLLSFSPTEDGECKFIFIFEFFKSTVERMKEVYKIYLHRENSRVKPEMCSLAVDGN